MTTIPVIVNRTAPPAEINQAVYDAPAADNPFRHYSTPRVNAALDKLCADMAEQQIEQPSSARDFIAETMARYAYRQGKLAFLNGEPIDGQFTKRYPHLAADYARGWEEEAASADGDQFDGQLPGDRH